MTAIFLVYPARCSFNVDNSDYVNKFGVRGINIYIHVKGEMLPIKARINSYISH